MTAHEDDFQISKTDPKLMDLVEESTLSLVKLPKTDDRDKDGKNDG
jgi:hypothetical protein